MIPILFISSDLGVLWPLHPAEFFSPPDKCDLGGTGRLEAQAATLISEFGTEPLESYASVRGSKLSDT